MIFFTGDIHGNVNGVADFINKVHPTMEDVIVLLGDVGANYYNGCKDYLMKQCLYTLILLIMKRDAVCI